ncbi:protein lethal(2)essential for life-like [Epargyreus clarus]|uniref:protein lethal(2)essential for life-like n=1 Tax=Epargyreus clarus TaxID=520877 RepID=UPI003C3076D4
MSLLPYVFGYDWPTNYRPSRLLDQDFGLALTPDDLLTVATAPLFSRDYYRPWRQLAAATRDLGSSIKADKDKFQLNLDVQHFAPEEITVKTTDGYIVVEGKHEEKKDEHGFISRQFVRRYALPQDCRAEMVESRLSSDGVLTITAPRHQVEAVKDARAIPIQQTGPVRKEIKDAAIKEDTKNLLGMQIRPKLYSWVTQTRNIRPIIKLSKEQFQLCLDVRQFKKEEICVKARPEYVIIEGKQERKTKRGYTVRQFSRKYKLPDGCNPQCMKSQISPDGMLTITAPRETVDINLPCETVVPITHSGPQKECGVSLITIEKPKPDTKK